METLFIYIVKVNIALTVFYLLYMLLFSKDTFIRLRRYYFLSAIIFSLAYPLITVSALGSLINLSKKETLATETSVYIGDVSMGEFIIDDVEEVATPIDWIELTKNILLVGVFLLSLRFLWQLLSIVRMKSRSEKRSLFGYLFYHLKDEITPFSFFNWIFIHTETHTEKELKQILLHEHTHARQWHSLDIVLVEMLRIAFWWNPLVWLIKRDMAINLEYLADQAVLQEGVETTEYQYHLLQLTYHETAVQIVNNFNVSQLKQRIIMMNTNKTPMRKLAKYLSIIPLVLLLITANSMYAQANEMQEPVKEIAPPPPPPPPPPAPPIEQHQTSYKRNLTAIMEFIKTEMKYPQIAKENGIQGRVLASFTIEKDGSVTNPKIVEGVDPSLDKEAMRIINAMPKWEPFIQDGVASKTEYTIPFHFDLDGKEKSNEYSIIGFKVVNAEGKDDVKVVGSGLIEEMPIQTLAEKFGTNKPIYIVDGMKTENIDNIDPKDIESITVLKNESAISKYGDEGKNGVIEVTTKSAITKNALMDAAREKLVGEIEDIFVVVEDQPQFIGGPEALMQYLGDNIKYPKEAHEKKIQGRVIANFVINTDGGISDVTIVRGVDPLLDAEAVRVISAMPNWKPGMQRGQTVRVRYTLPIVFSLNGDEKASKPKDDVFVVVEKQPEFPGGMEAMMKYLGDNIKYPVEAQKNKIEGRVIVNFVVNKNGSLSDMSIVRGQDPSLDAEAIRVIAAMPNWKPGMHKGEAVKVRFTLPIVFRLKEDKEVESEDIKVLLGEPSIVSRRDQKTDNKFYEFISQRIKYPVIAQENGISGVVRASYDVNSKGEISNIKITKGADPSLDAELKRIIQLMPNDVALMRSEGKAASNVALSANFIFGNAKMQEVRSQESDFVVMGYRNSTK